MAVSTLAEIQDAIDRLRADERNALSLWFNSQTPMEITASDEKRLLSSLDEAIRDVEAGKGIPIEDARKLVATWAQR